MSSLRGLARLTLREFHDQTRSHRFLVLTAMAGLLTPLVVYAGVRDYAGRRLQYDLLVQQRTLAAEQRGRNWLNGREAEPALRLIRPPDPRSLLVRGIEGSLPKFWDFAPEGVQAAAGSDTAARTPQSGVSLDVEFLIRIVLGLLAVSLAAGALATERDLGTLNTLMSQPVRASALVTAKLLGGVAAVSAALLIVITGTAAALGVFGPELWSSALRFTLIAVGVSGALYLSVLYSVGVVVGAVARSVSAANVAAMGIWLGLSVASVPAFEFLARVLVPVPAAEVTEARRQSEWNRRVRESEMALGDLYRGLAGTEWRQLTLSRTIPDTVRDPIRQGWAARAQETRAELTAIDAQAEQFTRGQRQVWARLSWSTPASLLFETASRLAGTGLPTAARWDATAMAFQTQLDAAVFDDPRAVTLLVPSDPGRSLMQIDFRPTSSRFAFAPPTAPDTNWRTAVVDARGPFGLLALYGLAAISLAFAAFSKTHY